MRKILTVVFAFITVSAFAEKYSLPVPEKYRNRISCGQGLREAISAEETGGLATSGMWHNGIDFLVPDRTEVYAVKDGIVRICYPSYFNGEKWLGHPVYGGMIVIEHFDGTYSLYGHLSMTEVREDDFVYRKQRIGLSGGVRNRRCSGISTGCHLHFALYMSLEDVFEDSETDF